MPSHFLASFLYHMFLCVAGSAGKEGLGGVSASQSLGGPEGVQAARGRHSPTIAVKGEAEVLFVLSIKKVYSGDLYYSIIIIKNFQCVMLFTVISASFPSGSFSVPSMCVELRGDVGEKEKPLVNLLLEEIKVTCESCEPFKNSTQVRGEALCPGRKLWLRETELL